MALTGNATLEFIKSDLVLERQEAITSGIYRQALSVALMNHSWRLSSFPDALLFGGAVGFVHLQPRDDVVSERAVFRFGTLGHLRF